ncbi:MAG: cation:proton antiporter [Salinivirgaceae bacterium]|nr:MAG: cation:proton antiporter [Salinivirgaceae bacterium]
MENIGLENIALFSGLILSLVGLWGLLTQKNIIKMIVGFALLDTGIHLIMIAVGYVKNSTAPIIGEGVTKANAADVIADPIPQALVLTAIVIGLGITALMLAYAVKMHQKKKSLDINHYKDLKW